LRNEYTTWIERDPHAGAYGVLFDARSAEIIKNLAFPGVASVPAHQNVRCLACHCEPHVGSATGLARHRVDGVGCEACHGSAANWVDAHTAPTVWDRLSAAEKELKGMVNVKDPLALATTCVGCHVGAPADAGRDLPLRDVNHELLAAGHPRLNFEFATFLANLPPHWKQSEGDTDSRASVRPWALGQVAGARAAVTLLADRARRAEATGSAASWPEFAEYDCSSCHHGLTPTSARQRRPPSSGLLGQSSWGNWYLSMPSRILQEGTTENMAFNSLTKHLEQPLPSLKPLPKLTGTALNTLAKIEAELNKAKDHDLTGVYRERLQRIAPPKDLTSWELAEQLSLTAVSLDRARLPRSIAADPGRTPTAVERVFDRLAFPKGTDGQGNILWDGNFERDFKAIMSSEVQPK
jgi:hypothetical protein